MLVFRGWKYLCFGALVLGTLASIPMAHTFNLSAEVVNKMMRSFVGSSVCHFLSNLHPFEHKIFLARHGESHATAFLFVFLSGWSNSRATSGDETRVLHISPTVSELKSIAYSPITVQHWHCDRQKTQQGEFNVDMRIGGDSGLSPRGEEFARRTAEFVALAEEYLLKTSWYSMQWSL